MTLGSTLAALSSSAGSVQADGLRALDGEWVYVEDRTEGRALEQLGPPMSSKFSLRIEEGAVILVSGHGSGHRNVRLALDGSATEVPGAAVGTFARYRGAWKDGAFTYETEFVRSPGKAPEGLIRREFRTTTDGLLVRVTLGSPATSDSIALYRHAQDIAMPTPAKAAIGDVAWLAGAWVGTRGTAATTSIEERWSPPLGGAMLAVSRTVSRDRMSAFEFLRIVERDGGLVHRAARRRCGDRVRAHRAGRHACRVREPAPRLSEAHRVRTVGRGRPERHDRFHERRQPPALRIQAPGQLMFMTEPAIPLARVKYPGWGVFALVPR